VTLSVQMSIKKPLLHMENDIWFLNPFAVGTLQPLPLVSFPSAPTFPSPSSFSTCSYITTTYLAKRLSSDDSPPTNSVNHSMLQTNARNPCPKKLFIREWDSIVVLHDYCLESMLTEPTCTPTMS
jgi:hypothetical protein